MNDCVDLLAQREEAPWTSPAMGPWTAYPPSITYQPLPSRAFSVALPNTRDAQGEYVWTIVWPDAAELKKASASG